MSVSKKTIDYRSLQSELDAIMTELQSESIDVDVALKQYKRGLEIIQQLESYLETAENTVTQLKAKFTLEP